MGKSRERPGNRAESPDPNPRRAKTAHATRPSDRVARPARAFRPMGPRSPIGPRCPIPPILPHRPRQRAPPLQPRTPAPTTHPPPVALTLPPPSHRRQFGKPSAALHFRVGCALRSEPLAIDRFSSPAATRGGGVRIVWQHLPHSHQRGGGREPGVSGGERVGGGEGSFRGGGLADGSAPSAAARPSGRASRQETRHQRQDAPEYGTAPSRRRGAFPAARTRRRAGARLESFFPPLLFPLDVSYKCRT